MEDVILLLGSNKGDRLDFLKRAVQKLRVVSKAPVKISSIYESEPWGFETETWFLNMAIRIYTDTSPEELLKFILDTERDLGRVRQTEISGYESREIDIDIIFFGTRVINTEELTVPHPKMHLRRFVLSPVCEISPDLYHPVLSEKVSILLDKCNDNSVVIKSCRTLE